jgi:hypothetical protein
MRRLVSDTGALSQSSADPSTTICHPERSEGPAFASRDYKVHPLVYYETFKYANNAIARAEDDKMANSSSKTNVLRTVHGHQSLVYE